MNKEVTVCQNPFEGDDTMTEQEKNIFRTQLIAYYKELDARIKDTIIVERFNRTNNIVEAAYTYVGTSNAIISISTRKFELISATDAMAIDEDNYREEIEKGAIELQEPVDARTPTPFDLPMPNMITIEDALDKSTADIIKMVSTDRHLNPYQLYLCSKHSTSIEIGANNSKRGNIVFHFEDDSRLIHRLYKA